MLIIAAAYAALIWLIFSRLKLVRWSWPSGALVAVGGIAILGVFLALFNSLTPSGSFVVVSRVIEITPNVAGQIVELPVKANVPVKKGDMLFQIDKAPFEYQVKQLKASLAQAKQQADELQGSYDQASATVEGLKQQQAYNKKRLDDISQLAGEGAQSEFRRQDTQVQFETVSAQLLAAQATQTNAKIALDAQIGGVNPAVAQIAAQLEDAAWQLDQTTVRAPEDGVVTSLALSIGDRAVPARSVMSFVVADEISIIGFFAPNGFQTVAPGARVKLIFDDRPGSIHEASILEIPLGVGQGQIAVSGNLARVGSIGGVGAYPATISLPASVDKASLKLGMPGSATVFNERSGAIGLLMSIIVWVKSYLAYL